MLLYTISIAILVTAHAVQRIVIDTDPGLDDILSILVALGDPEVEVIAITCVRGNSDIHNVVRNTLQTLNVAKKDVPVFVGAAQGLVESPPFDYYFGSNGLSNVSLPELHTLKRVESSPAAIYLASVVERYPGEITIMALGPLTNIALAIHLNPKFLLQAREVITFGGAVRGDGNRIPGVEFNMYTDAAAASFVFDQALPPSKVISLVPWETVIKNDLGWDWRWNVVGMIPNAAVSFLNRLERIQQERIPELIYVPADIYAIGIALVRNFIIGYQNMYISVEYRGQKSQGVVLVDYTNITSNAANVKIVTKIDTSALRQRIYDNLSNLN